MVQEKGLEPPLLSKLDPKSSASANFATPANYTLYNIKNYYSDKEASFFLQITDKLLLIESKTFCKVF
jgi:hypothetical protein